jgi:hypothetical protein
VQSQPDSDTLAIDCRNQKSWLTDATCHSNKEWLLVPTCHKRLYPSLTHTGCTVGPLDLGPAAYVTTNHNPQHRTMAMQRPVSTIRLQISQRLQPGPGSASGESFRCTIVSSCFAGSVDIRPFALRVMFADVYISGISRDGSRPTLTV